MADPKPASAQDVIDTLKSMDQSLKALVAHFGALRVPVNGNVPPSRPAYDVPQVASDRDLDGQWGDEQVKFDPRDWTGDRFKHAQMSECPAPFLELLAAAYDVFAERDDDAGEKDAKGKPKSFYAKRTAARARGWAKRLRGGWTPPAQDDAPAFPSDATTELTDDDITF